MIWMKLFTLITFTCVITPGALGASDCTKYTPMECQTIHDAIDNCKANCGQGNPTDTTAGGATTAASGTEKPGKGKVKGKKGGGGHCFHGDDTVITNNGQMKIQDLVGREDVQVMSRNEEGQLEFSPVYSWLHANPSQKSEFIVFTTESGHKMSITDVHLIYETDCRGNSKTVFARKVKTGSCLYVNENGQIKESKIVDKKVETKVGIFAPITTNGNVVVNGVLASCFTNHENEEFQKIIYSFLHTVGRVFVKIAPSSLFEFFYSTPFDAVVDVPQAFLSFFDLNKVFMK